MDGWMDGSIDGWFETKIGQFREGMSGLWKTLLEAEIHARTHSFNCSLNVCFCGDNAH